VRARAGLRGMIPKSLAGSVEFYDPVRYCSAAPVRDNLLFGRIAYGIANAQETVSEVIKSALAESGLLDTVYRIGLDYQVGPHGRLLFPRQRAAVDLARCLIKHPEIFILDDALHAFQSMEAKVILERLIGEFEGRSLITFLPGLDNVGTREMTITFDKGRVTRIDRGDEAAPAVGDEAMAQPKYRSRRTQVRREDEGAVQAQVAE